METIAFCQQKGGVGKTTVAVGAAERAAEQGLRVLLVDMDPQGNASAHLGVDVTEDTLTMADVLYVPASAQGRVEPGIIVDAICDSGPAWAGQVDVVPANMALDDREYDQVLGREMRLRTAMAGDELASRYDLVLIDCRPSLGQLTVNALNVADQVVCVTEPRANSVDGLPVMLAAIEQVREFYNPKIRVAGIAVNRHQPHRTDPVAWLGKLVDTYGALLIEPFIPEREFIAKASTEAQPLFAYPAPAGAKAEITEALDAIVARLVNR